MRALGAAREELEAEAPEGAAADPFAAAHDGRDGARAPGTGTDGERQRPGTRKRGRGRAR